jgi:rubrerythrin
MVADAAAMAYLLELERTAVIAYRTVLPKLSTSSARVVAHEFMRHEEAHRDALEHAMHALHARVPPVRPTSRYSAGFPPIRTGQDALRFVLDIENTQVSAYAEALTIALIPDTRVALASILGAEAEHMSVILGELHKPQASQALVTGSAPA